MKKLPVGIQSFRQIIEEAYVYADKTREIYNLVTGGKYYFLSRPRRFGKSLLVDTVAELFSGDHTLFNGLWIAGPESDYSFPRHPVLRIDMTQFSMEGPERLEESIAIFLRRVAEREGIVLEGGIPAVLLTGLIEALAAKYGRRVVVLVDEYDKPIVDHSHDPAMAGKMRFSLGNLYGVLKGQDASLQFVLLTGITKFAKLSLFSKLNNLADLTLWDEYAGICGITEADFDTLFAQHLEAYQQTVDRKLGHPDAGKSLAELRQKVFEWYDGYTWDGETRVFNPFSLLSFFQKREFEAFWFKTGVPAFQMRQLKERPWEYAQVQEAVITELLLDSHDIEDAPAVSLLFQTGFLTVRSVGYGTFREYSLGFPNEEVSQSFAQLFLSAIANVPDPLALPFHREMSAALDSGELEDIGESLAGLYASLPYELHVEVEAYYHSIFLAVMQFLGFRVIGEVSVAQGRADGVLDRPCGKSYVIEFKYVADAAALPIALDEAFAQIEQRGYTERYRGTRRTVYKLAIAVAAKGKVAVRAERA